VRDIHSGIILEMLDNAKMDMRKVNLTMWI
jgi:hypothetical protein